MEGTAPVKKRQAWNSRDPPVGKDLPDCVEGRAVLFAPVGRNEYRPVYDEEIGVGCGDSLTSFIVAGRGPGKTNEPIRTAFPGPEGFQFLGHIT